MKWVILGLVLLILAACGGGPKGSELEAKRAVWALGIGYVTCVEEGDHWLCGGRVSARPVVAEVVCTDDEAHPCFVKRLRGAEER
jgi:hypothetical protein